MRAASVPVAAAYPGGARIPGRDSVAVTGLGVFVQLRVGDSRGRPSRGLVGAERTGSSRCRGETGWRPWRPSSGRPMPRCSAPQGEVGRPPAVADPLLCASIQESGTTGADGAKVPSPSLMTTPRPREPGPGAGEVRAPAQADRGRLPGGGYVARGCRRGAGGAAQRVADRPGRSRWPWPAGSATSSPARDCGRSSGYAPARPRSPRAAPANAFPSRRPTTSYDDSRSP